MNPNVSVRNGITATQLEWSQVDEPASQGYFVEAFARGDALIDTTGESLLRHIYNGHEAQDLLNQIRKAHGASLNGTSIFQILKNKGIISGDLLSQIQAFKKARNQVLHTVEGAYGLIDLEQLKTINDQETFDARMKDAARSHLINGARIFYLLIDVFQKIASKRPQN